MICPRCNVGTIFAYVYTLNKHAVYDSGEIVSFPVCTANPIDSLPTDYASCDYCDTEFIVDGDNVLNKEVE